MMRELIFTPWFFKDFFFKVPFNSTRDGWKAKPFLIQLKSECFNSESKFNTKDYAKSHLELNKNFAPKK